MNNIVIRSLSRQSSSTSSSNYIVQLNTPFIVGNKRKLKLVYFVCYNTIYNVSSSNNNIDFKSGATTYSASVSAGIYDATTLATSLQTAMNNQLAGFTVSYNINQKTYTISNASSFSLLFSSGSHASTSLWQVLGFSSSNGLNGVDTASATSTTSTQAVDFNLPLSMYIKLNNISTVEFLSSDQDYFSFYLPLNSSNGSIVEYTENQYFEQYITIPDNMRVINRFEVQYSGPNGTSVNLNGSESELVLSLCN